MKIEWLITDVKTSNSPARAESDFWGEFGRRLAVIQAACVVREPLFDLLNPLLSAKNLTYNHLMKTECLILGVTAVGSPAIFLIFLAFLANSGQFCGSGSHFAISTPLSWALTYLRKVI